jgi:predicted ester cyclase
MSIQEQNKAVVSRLYDEVINQGRRDVIDQIYHADVVIHDPFMGTRQGVDAFRQLLNVFDTGLPGHTAKMEVLVAEGEYVMSLHTHYATHSGPFMGAPATGRQALVNGIELFRLRDGQIVEFWRKDDDVSLLIQLGLMPAPVVA